MWMAQQPQGQEAINRQAAIDRQKAYEESARQMEKPQEAYGSWSNSSANPLNRGPYRDDHTASRGGYIGKITQAPPGSQGGGHISDIEAKPRITDRAAEVHQREQQRTLLEDQKADLDARINRINPETDKHYYTDKPRLDQQRHHLQNAIDDTYRPAPSF